MSRRSCRRLPRRCHRIRCASRRSTRAGCSPRSAASRRGAGGGGGLGLHLPGGVPGQRLAQAFLSAHYAQGPEDTCAQGAIAWRQRGESGSERSSSIRAVKRRRSSACSARVAGPEKPVYTARRGHRGAKDRRRIRHAPDRAAASCARLFFIGHTGDEHRVLGVMEGGEASDLRRSPVPDRRSARTPDRGSRARAGRTFLQLDKISGFVVAVGAPGAKHFDDTRLAGKRRIAGARLRPFTSGNCSAPSSDCAHPTHCERIVELVPLVRHRGEGVVPAIPGIEVADKTRTLAAGIGWPVRPRLGAAHRTGTHGRRRSTTAGGGRHRGCRPNSDSRRSW